MKGVTLLAQRFAMKRAVQEILPVKMSTWKDLVSLSSWESKVPPPKATPPNK